MNPLNVTELFYIYGLIDPRTNCVRYVGKAKNTDQRFSNHWCPSGRSDKTPKGAWFRKLHRLGLKPLLVILDVVPEEEWHQAEREWIAHYRKQQRLFNFTDGGEGGATYGFRGHRHGDEFRRKYRATRLGKTIQQRDPEGKRAAAIRAAWARRRAEGRATWPLH